MYKPWIWIYYSFMNDTTTIRGVLGVGEETWFRWFADSLPAELTR